MPKKKIDYHEHNDDLPETTSVASANECTGLMPNSPKSEAERESFEQLSPMAIPSEPLLPSCDKKRNRTEK